MSWNFSLTAAAAWETMLADCELATKSIDLEQYIFSSRGIGERFAGVFVSKVHSGVRVRLLLDMVGSYFFYHSPLCKELIRQGVQIKFYNRISPWRIHTVFSWLFRTHRKMLIVDGAIGHTGGVGINEAMRTWRDTHVRVTGPVVTEMAEAFAVVWDRHFLTHVWFSRKLLREAEAAGLHFIVNAPVFGKRRLYQAIVASMRQAHDYLYITMPYFIPDLRLLRIVRLAARRGVDVRILLPAHSDHYFIDLASQSYFGLFLRAGAQIYRYTATTLHAKVICTDDAWATIGSSNLDSLSMQFNYEGNIVSTNEEFNRGLREQFLEDIRTAQKISSFEWERRPFLEKFLELCTWPFHPIL